MLLAGITLFRANAPSIERDACERTLHIIRSEPMLQGVPVVVITEAAPGVQASYIVGHLASYARDYGITIHWMRELANNDIGVLKTGLSDDSYRFALLFALENRVLAFWNRIATVHPQNTSAQELDRLCDMIRGIHFDSVKQKISLKVEGRANDILAALIQLLYWANRFWKDHRYALQRHEIVEKANLRFPFPLIGTPDPQFNAKTKRH